MLKLVTIAVCDICGKIEWAKEVPGRSGEMGCTLPDGWTPAPANATVHLCPECARKLKMIGRHG